MDFVGLSQSLRKDAIGLLGAFNDEFLSGKLGEATMYWRKVDDRVQWGVGNPCALLPVDLLSSIVNFHEDKAALDEGEAAEQARDAAPHV